jgi:hypothetical protein
MFIILLCAPCAGDVHGCSIGALLQVRTTPKSHHHQQLLCHLGRFTILTPRSPQDCSVHITTVAAVRWATDLRGPLSRILVVSWVVCVCVACPLSPVSVRRVSLVCPRSSAQSGWVLVHAGDACTTVFLFSPAACLLPATCCVFHRCVFPPPLVQHPRDWARVFSVRLIFSHPPSRAGPAGARRPTQPLSCVPAV